MEEIIGKSCFQWFKDTNLKANHNRCSGFFQRSYVVFNGSKILIWKQITTASPACVAPIRCFQWFKDTNLKANHNRQSCRRTKTRVVFNGSKILIWKQITTASTLVSANMCCFQWFKDTNLKANHNLVPGVPASSWSCFQWFKDTNLKANHNWIWFWISVIMLFSMVQRY